MSINLNEHLAQTRKIKTLKGLFERYDAALEAFGYARHVFLFFPPKKDGLETIPCCPHLDFPKNLVQVYLEEKIYQVGPAFETVKKTGRPVVWKDFLGDDAQLSKSPKLLRFIELFKSGGFSNGVTFPVFGPANSFGHFSLSRKKGEVHLDDPDIAILNHVCIDLMKQYMRIADLDGGTEKTLTLREKEVLSWVLQGKSNSVIAELMGISEHTVSTYIRRSSKKLDTSSKWGAAISAVLTGIMHY